ncbi:alkaline phosphatase, tissue-nonspecific isozyme-like isoform X1 [Scylla paramamosain]|uniref:alkaline phosphatase, tissue-nonspecific isozyme-like isoform X1 n=1 Tax=Scylla paramamosain TaxID=85552 RepID=UPI003083B180
MQRRGQVNTGLAKNIIVFIGDGVRMPVSVAARVYKRQMTGACCKEAYLEWEKFPYLGLLKSCCQGNYLRDTAATATAMMTGVKAKPRHPGAWGGWSRGTAAPPSGQKTSYLLSWTGRRRLAWLLDSSPRGSITVPFPASLYAKSTHQDWHCRTPTVPKGMPQYKDIGRQLVEDNPGKMIKVIMGGGRRILGAEEERGRRQWIQKGGWEESGGGVEEREGGGGKNTSLRYLHCGINED